MYSWKCNRKKQQKSSRIKKHTHTPDHTDGIPAVAKMKWSTVLRRTVCSGSVSCDSDSVLSECPAPCITLRSLLIVLGRWFSLFTFLLPPSRRPLRESKKMSCCAKMNQTVWCGFNVHCYALKYIKQTHLWSHNDTKFKMKNKMYCSPSKFDYLHQSVYLMWEGSCTHSLFFPPSPKLRNLLWLLLLFHCFCCCCWSIKYTTISLI